MARLTPAQYDALERAVTKGSRIAIDKRGNRAFETGWGTEKYGLSSDGSSWVQTVPFLYGAGGGISQVFPEPAYQRGIVPRGTTGRAVPDVGMDADPTTGMLVGETQNFSLPSRSPRPTRVDGGSASPTRSSTPSRACRASSTT